jgi:hypothetical protein
LFRFEAGKEKACSQHTRLEGCNALKKDAPSHTPTGVEPVKGFFEKCCSF